MTFLADVLKPALCGKSDFGIITRRAFDKSYNCTAQEREAADMTYKLYLCVP